MVDDALNMAALDLDELGDLDAFNDAIHEAADEPLNPSGIGFLLISICI